MTAKRLIKKTWLVGPIAAAILGAGALIGCAADTGIGEGGDSGGQTMSREISESGSERGGSEAGGEHGSAMDEGGGAEGTEGAEDGSDGSEEDSGAMLAPDETFDMVRGGARLVMGYDPASNAFNGTVENTTNKALTNVRIEIHLSNGTELGPTTPMDMAPGEVATVTLPSTPESFTGWVPHAEVGRGDGGGESVGEHGAATGSDGEGRGEHDSDREGRGGN